MKMNPLRISNLLAIALLAFTYTAIFTFNIPLCREMQDQRIHLQSEGERYEVQFNPSHLYVDHGGRLYTFRTAPNQRMLDITAGDIDSDGHDELLILFGKEGSRYGNDLVIDDLSLHSGKPILREIYRNDIGKINPWKIEICELDGDEKPEIFIAVHKATYYYKDVENRPFFFNFVDGKLVKKWTGSKVRAPFTDAYFEDLTGSGRDEWIVVEEAESGKAIIAVYYWFGFGFTLQVESPMYDAVKNLSVLKTKEGTELRADVIKNNRFTQVRLYPSSEKTKDGIYVLKERGIY